MDRRAFLAVASAWAAAPAKAADQVFVHRGFTVDQTDMGGRAAAAVRKALERQVDIIVESRPPAEMLAFMRRQRTFVLRNPSFKGPGHFNEKRGIETISSPDPDKPILLHEMLHALHLLWMPQGRSNPTIAAAYAEAKRRKLWSDDYLMKNDREFFAVTGSCYLFGVVEREPRNRANIRRALPSYYQWMADLFDGGRPR
jgi:hypothetical protein